MGRADVMRNSTRHQIQLGGRVVDYRVVQSNAARKLRVRIGPDGVEVVHPVGRNREEASGFLMANERWVLEQLDRVDQLRSLRRAVYPARGQILFRGEPTRVRVEPHHSRSTGNLVRMVDGAIVVSHGPRSRTPVARSLEFWLRRQARQAINDHLSRVTARLGCRPARVYIMGQRTKWGNCSSRRNLSFNWRLILAPEFVLRYLVTHETVHLAIPDHSAKFWLTVQSLCRETERARQWLVAHAEELAVDLPTACTG
jgi:predicted metal-dependent hydrolase